MSLRRRRFLLLGESWRGLTGVERWCPWRVRTKAALAAAKAKGKQLGNYQRIAAAEQRATTERAEAVRPAIAKMAHLSARAAADELNRRRITTTSGKPWDAMQITRLRDRLGL
jgi:DNA invertase Pin-like site-specific DNA recombinase